MKLSGLIFLFSLLLIFNFNLNNAQPVPDKVNNDVDIIIPDENGKIAGSLEFGRRCYWRNGQRRCYNNNNNYRYNNNNRNWYNNNNRNRFCRNCGYNNRRRNYYG